MTEDLSQLSEAKRALLVQELAKRRARARVAATIPRRPADEPPPLSLAQRRLWFLDRVAPGKATYNATLTMRMVGPLDVEALHEALDTIVQRHEALRTVGIDVNGAPEGRLLDEPVPWRMTDADEDKLPALLRADAAEPFDLSADVMLRARLYRLAPEVHVLILVQHHIASDGASRGILFGELTELYNAKVAGRPHTLAPLAIQYGDFARWHNEAVENGLLVRDDEFWRAELAGADLMLDLPSDFPASPGGDAHQGERVRMDGADGSGDQLRALARAEGATFFMATMAAGGAFLSALTGQHDVLLGSPVANRQRPELDALIGFFVNTVVLRVRLQGDPTFRELLRRCRATVIACLAHQDMPLDRLVELINPIRVPGRNPLFQVNFRMQGIAPPPPQLTGLEVTRMITDTGAARFELAFGFVDQPGPLRGYLEYGFDRFRRTTIEVWQASFLDLVARAVDDPDVRMSELLPAVRDDIRARRDQLTRQAAPARSIRRTR